MKLPCAMRFLPLQTSTQETIHAHISPRGRAYIKTNRPISRILGRTIHALEEWSASVEDSALVLRFLSSQDHYTPRQHTIRIRKKMKLTDLERSRIETLHNENQGISIKALVPIASEDLKRPLTYRQVRYALKDQESQRVYLTDAQRATRAEAIKEAERQNPHWTFKEIAQHVQKTTGIHCNLHSAFKASSRPRHKKRKWTPVEIQAIQGELQGRPARSITPSELAKTLSSAHQITATTKQLQWVVTSRKLGTLKRENQKA